MPGKLVWLYASFLFVPFILLLAIAAWFGVVSSSGAATGLGGILFVALFIAGFQWWSMRANDKRRVWVLTDEGLQRVSPSGERETIPWEQVRKMIWARYIGLIINWRPSTEPGETKPPEEDSRAGICIGREQAAELAALWRQKCPQDEEARSRQRSRQGKIGVVLIGIGAVFTFVISTGVIWSCRTYHWPSVDGKIVSMHYETDNGKNPMGSLGLSYEYAVAGQSHRSDQIRSLSKSYRKEAVTVQSFARDHQEGMAVKVYYDPKSPADTVVLQGPDWIYAGFLLPLGPLIFGLGFSIWRHRKRSGGRDAFNTEF